LKILQKPKTSGMTKHIWLGLENSGPRKLKKVCKHLGIEKRLYTNTNNITRLRKLISNNIVEFDKHKFNDLNDKVIKSLCEALDIDTNDTKDVMIDNFFQSMQILHTQRKRETRTRNHLRQPIINLDSDDTDEEEFVSVVDDTDEEVVPVVDNSTSSSEFVLSAGDYVNSEEEFEKILKMSADECQSTDKTNTDTVSTECAICLSATKSAVFDPCHHVAACFDCATKIKFSTGTCPICRSRIQSVTKIYLS
jgi:hypothetical protein